MASNPHCLKSSDDESAAGMSAFWARQTPLRSRQSAGMKNRERITGVRDGNVAPLSTRCRGGAVMRKQERIRKAGKEELRGVRSGILVPTNLFPVFLRS